MSGDRKFCLRDHAGKIILVAPFLAFGITTGVGSFLNWYSAHRGIPVPLSIAYGVIVLPGVIAFFGGGTGGFLARRSPAARIAAAAGGGTFSLAVYIGLLYAFVGLVLSRGV